MSRPLEWIYACQRVLHIINVPGTYAIMPKGFAYYKCTSCHIHSTTVTKMYKEYTESVAPTIRKTLNQNCWCFNCIFLCLFCCNIPRNVLRSSKSRLLVCVCVYIFFIVSKLWHLTHFCITDVKRDLACLFHNVNERNAEFVKSVYDLGCQRPQTPPPARNSLPTLQNSNASLLGN